MNKSKAIIFLSALLSILSFQQTFAQCPAGVAPSYPIGCTDQYFTSISASGPGVTSTISYSGSSCIGDYFDNYLSQGVSAPTGSTVTINFNRFARYLAYLAVYVDWNNNGTYETTELAGSAVTLPAGVTAGTCAFTIPLIGIATNTNLHMRVFLGEPAATGGPITSINPPCSARWGESIDYYLVASCTNPALSIAPVSPKVCEGGNITLTASGAGPTPTYIWSPATALSSTRGAVVVSTPTLATTYTLTGYGPGVCAASTTTIVTILPAITTAISAGGPTTFCSGNSVTLSETVGAGATYQWYIGATLIPGATNRTYAAAPTTTASISVVATSSMGCTASAAVAITVLPTPAAVITPIGPATVCYPSTVTLNATAVPGYTYRWFGSGGAILGEVAQNYTVTNTDGYAVEITSPAGCIDTSSSLFVTILPSPVATATAAGPFNFCASDSVILTAVSSPGYTYQWMNGTTPIPGEVNMTLIARTPGIFNYRVQVTNPFGCSDITPSGLFPVTVHALPVSKVSAAGPLSFCTGGSVLLGAPFVPGNSYQWYFGTTKTAMSAIPLSTSSSLTATAAGYYSVTVYTPLGCTSSSDTAVQVTVAKPTSISSSSSLNICKGSDIKLSSGVFTPIAGATFQWFLNGIGIPGANAATYTTKIAGRYTCYVNIPGSCDWTTPSVTVSINTLPTPVITYSSGLLMTDKTYKSYQWYLDGKIVPGATLYRITPVKNGNYTVMVTDTNLCSAGTESYSIRILAAENIPADNARFIYPNPATDKIHVSYARNVTIEISSMDGKMLMRKQDTKEADISTLSSGTYIISVYDDADNKLLSEKLIKN